MNDQEKITGLGSGPGGNASPRPRRTQADRSDQAITALRAAALDMLLEGGVGALNLTELGDRAGYSRGIVHYHFGSKEALLLDLLRSVAASGRSAFEVAAKMGPGGVAHILETLEQSVRAEPRVSLARILLLNEAAASGSEALREVAKDYNRDVRDAFTHLIALDRWTEPAEITAEQAGILFLAAVRGLYHQWLIERDAFDIASALRSLRLATLHFRSLEPE